MIPNDQPLRKQTIERMLDVCATDAHLTSNDLTKWECDFIDSISEQFETKGDLSTKQCEILEKIYDKL